MIILKLKNKIIAFFKNDAEELENNIINLFRKEFINIENDNYRLKILQLILENKKLVKNLKFFIHHSIKGKISTIKDLISDNGGKNDFLKFIDSYKDDIIFSFFDKSESEVVNQILLFYFENLFNDYFISLISKLENKKKKIQKKLLMSKV